MKTTVLLDKLNFQPTDIKGLFIDAQMPNEFILSVFKDNGAERWRLYGDKKNFCVALGSDTKHQVISACPIEEAIPYLKEFLSKSTENQHFARALEVFAEKRNSLKAPQEELSESASAFLGSQKQRTLPAPEITQIVNAFREKSGYEPSFSITEPTVRSAFRP